MKVVFDEDSYQEIEIEGKGTFIGGGLRVSALPGFKNFTVESALLSENTVSADNLKVGQIIGLTTVEYGKFEKPFVVTEREKDTDEDSDIKEIIRLGFCGSEDITEGVILTRGRYRDYSASYYDHTTSRFVTSDEFQTYLIPDLILAEVFGNNLKRKILPYCL